jgi:hypothetical protein
MLRICCSRNACLRCLFKSTEHKGAQLFLTGFYVNMENNTVKPLLTDLYGVNHDSDKPISRMS